MGPDNKAYQRCEDAEEDDIAPHGWTHQCRQRGCRRVEGKERQRGYDTVKECLARYKGYGIVGVEVAQNQRIDCEADSGGKRQEVAYGVHLDDKARVEDDAGHTEEGHYRAYHHARCRTLALVDCSDEHCREKRRGCRDERYVGRKRIFKGHILGNEIDRSRTKSADHKQ